MTQIQNGRQSGSTAKQASPADLRDAIRQQKLHERVSFHTPGHRGYASTAEVMGPASMEKRLRHADLGSAAWLFDATELPGLDELSHPTGVLRDLEQRAAQRWDTHESLLSVNGASAAILAAICACAPRGKKILLPRNVHRSAINAVVITGLEPVWYEPLWNEEWECWAEIAPAEFEKQLSAHSGQFACAMAVSPTYSGAISDIEKLAAICASQKVPLIVDEAHGAHLIPSTAMPPSAVSQGADIVIHSLHKTLSALTQTGLLHRSKNCPVDSATLRACLNMVQSSSPSYVLLASIEQAIHAMEATSAVHRIENANRSLRMWLNKSYTTYCHDPAHILIKLPGMSAQQLYDALCDAAVYPETVIGNGVLLLLSVHTASDDIDYLVATLDRIAAEPRPAITETSGGTNAQFERSQNSNEQVLLPRDAFFARTEMVPRAQAVGRISADCLAPCPPGTPIVVPGQRLTQDILCLCTQTELRVVEGDC